MDLDQPTKINNLQNEYVSSILQNIKSCEINLFKDFDEDNKIYKYEFDFTSNDDKIHKYEIVFKINKEYNFSLSSEFNRI
jgi:hypothetical protein